jgi:hypothetical protein
MDQRSDITTVGPTQPETHEGLDDISGSTGLSHDGEQTANQATELQRILGTLPRDASRDLYSYFTSPAGSDSLKPFLDALTQWRSTGGLSTSAPHPLSTVPGMFRGNRAWRVVKDEIRRARQVK